METFDHVEDELTNEFIGDIEHSLASESRGTRLGGSKSHSPAEGERGRKNRSSNVYQAGKENSTMVMVVVLNILIQEQLQKIAGSSCTMWGARIITCPAWRTS